MKKNLVIEKDLGLIDYSEAWELQGKLNKSLIKRKRDFFDAGVDRSGFEPQHYLLFCQHPPVYTLGKSGSIDHLLLDEKDLQSNGFQYYKINRGGDITYHGPGQLVVYPIFDMEWFFRDVHKYVRFLEEAVILALKDFGIEAHREEGFTGVWMQSGNNDTAKKLCAIGVHFSRWVSMHGLALNINTELKHFENIIPCGISPLEKQVTSMQKELGRSINLDEVKARLKVHFSNLFNFDFKIESD